MRATNAIGLALACLCAVAAARASEPPRFRPEVQRALDRLKAVEPSVQEIQQAALGFFKIDFDTVQSMHSRASWKSLLPTVQGKYSRYMGDVDLGRWDYTIYQDRRVGDDRADTLTNEFEVIGAWDLSRLVFNPEVLDVTSLVVLQEAILKEITRIYFTRRRLQIDLILTPPTDEATLLSKELRVDELTATLDAMTGGKFSKTVQERTTKVDAGP